MSAFEEIYKKYALTVKKYVMSLGADDDLSDDITADTFFKAMKNIDSYDGQCKMLTWLCSIAKNTYFNHIKKKDNNNLPIINVDDILDNEPSLDIYAEEAERKIILYRKLMLIDDPYRDVIYLRVFACLSFREIGDIFSKNENWARVTFYRGKNKLKGMIENEI